MQTKIGEGLTVPHNMGIVISGNAIIGKNVTIMQQVTIGDNITKEKQLSPVIGDNVFIGAGAKIIGNCTIGNNVKIGANSVITKNIPDCSTVVGINQIVR